MHALASLQMLINTPAITSTVTTRILGSVLMSIGHAVTSLLCRASVEEDISGLVVIAAQFITSRMCVGSLAPHALAIWPLNPLQHLSANLNPPPTRLTPLTPR